MKIIIPLNIYEWLRYMEILPNSLNYHDEVVQIPTNQSQYIQNGYLVAKTLKKIIPVDTREYEMLLKVRQITVLKTDQNWLQIKLVMQNLGFQIDFCDEIDAQVIVQMLQFLYQKYAPPQVQKQSLKRKKISFEFDIVHFNNAKPLSQSKNLLQFMILLIMRSFNLRVDQALGLLINKCVWLKRLLKFGTNSNDYGEVKYFYECFLQNYQIFKVLVLAEEIHLGHILEGLSHGVLSQSQEVCQKSLQIYQRMKNHNWMKQEGFKKLMLSEHKAAFNFLLQHSYPKHKELFNQSLPLLFKKKQHFLGFVLRLLKNLPKHLYGKQIIQVVSFDFYIQRVLQFLDPQQDQPENVRQLARSILMTAILHYQSKIANTNLRRILFMGFQFQPHHSLKENLSLISTLFEIIEHLMITKHCQTENYFKTALSYVQLGDKEASHFALQNFYNLYTKFRQYFPIKFFLNFYPYEMKIAQNIDYQLLSFVANQPALSVQQVQLCLDICFYYFLKEIHCDCFLDLINILLKKKSGNWVSEHLSQIFLAWKQLHPDGFNSNRSKANNTLNRKKVTQKKQFGSIGVKRKEMIQVKQYQNFCHALIAFLQVPSKKVLQQLMNYTKKYLSEFDKKPEKQISIVFLKDFQKKINLAISNFKQTTHSYNLVQNKVQLTESQIIQNYSINKQKARQNAMKKQIQEYIQPSFGQSQVSQRNQFMNLTGFENQNQASDSISQKVYDPVLPFEEFDKIEPNVVYYSKELLEQYQIVYLDMLFQKYSNLVDKVVYVYQKCDDLQSFLMAMDVLRLTPIQEAEQVWIKAKARNVQTDKQLIQDFIIQVAMLVFTFEKNRAPQISCVQSFIKKLEINVQKKNAKTMLQGFNQASQNSINRKKSYQINKQIEFTSKMSLKYHIKDQYAICLTILNQIIRSEFNSQVIQLMSQVVNKVDTRVFTEVGVKETINMRNVQKLMENNNKICNKFSKTLKKKYLKKIISESQIQRRTRCLNLKKTCIRLICKIQLQNQDYRRVKTRSQERNQAQGNRRLKKSLRQ